MFQTLSDWFWWDRIWLPCNYTWDDLENEEGTGSVSPSQLYITIPLALLFMLLRFAFERAIATPVASAMGIKSKLRLKASNNPVFESFYISCSKHPSHEEMYGLAKKSNRTSIQVERWFRRRRNQDRPAVLKKFQESCWRFTFYLCALVGGVAVLYDKPWFHDVWEVWVGYPKQEVLTSQYWYYVMELSFYWALLFSVASDVRRKDFKVQVVHHLATIFLLNFSWSVKYIRVGTLTLLVHDLSDILLEVKYVPMIQGNMAVTKANSILRKFHKPLTLWSAANGSWGPVNNCAYTMFSVVLSVWKASSHLLFVFRRPKCAVTPIGRGHAMSCLLYLQWYSLSVG
ncbi:hypothetical protein XENTR_v10009358 [Xenopus tropicalis]|nr:hypothetical protein XENTR_v10009358 [Xenopus tropicalis]